MTKRKNTEQVVVLKRGRGEVEIENPSELLENLTPDDYELETAAEELENAQGATVTIYRQGAHGRDWVFIDTIMPSQYTPVMLKHPPYNGGTFRIVMRRADGTIRVNRALAVEPAPQAAVTPSPINGVPVLAGDQGIAILGKAMVEGFGRIGEAMAKLGELVVTNRAPVQEQKGLRDLLGDVTALKELIAPVSPASDPLAMLQSLLGIVKELPGRGDDDAPPRGRATEMDVLLEAARAILPQLAAHAQVAPSIPMAGPPGLPGPARPTPQPRPAVAAPGPQPTGAAPVQIDPAALMLNFLVQQAQHANDPEPYAVVVLDNVPPEIVEQWRTRADWFDEICKIAPNAAPYRGWFDKLHEHVVGYLTSDENSAQNDGGPAQGTPPNAQAAPGS